MSAKSRLDLTNLQSPVPALVRRRTAFRVSPLPFSDSASHVRTRGSNLAPDGALLCGYVDGVVNIIMCL